jgi:hypothetical protein
VTSIILLGRHFFVHSTLLSIRYYPREATREAQWDNLQLPLESIRKVLSGMTWQSVFIYVADATPYAPATQATTPVGNDKLFAQSHETKKASTCEVLDLQAAFRIGS